jgi:hypothetical protein
MADNYTTRVGSNWRRGFQRASMEPDPEPEGPGLV